jgi:hypothetical protein
MSTERTASRIARFALASVVAMAAAGCGEQVREGRSPAYLMVTKMTASSGAEPDKDSDELSSDVVTNGGVVEDLGLVQFKLALKDIGQPGSPASPTANNFITVTRYHVSYRRSDGRSTPGVDVPFPFDGAGTVTVSDKDASMAFVLVRVQAKLESPLKNLREGGGALAISTIADVTFYGRDQAGNEVTTSASISVNFADWADPAAS